MKKSSFLILDEKSHKSFIHTLADIIELPYVGYLALIVVSVLCFDDVAAL